jgi:hypothetical protein
MGVSFKLKTFLEIKILETQENKYIDHFQWW